MLDLLWRGTNQEQDIISQWPCGLHRLLLLSVLVLPEHAPLDHYPGGRDLVLTVEEELACLLIRQR